MHSVKALKQHVASLKPSRAGKLLCYLFSKSEKVALRNMEIALGDYLTVEERQKLIHCFASHILRTAYEIFMIRFLSIEKISSKVELRNTDNLLKARQKGKGILLFSAHIGNWEFAPLGGAIQLKLSEHKAYIIRKKVPNPYLEKLLFGHFEKVGIRILEKGRSLRPVFEILKDNGLVILPFDQYANPSGPRGILVHFFGRLVGTYKGLAKIAQKSGATVLPVIPYRLASGKHVLEFLPHMTWIENADPQQEILLNTEAYNRVIEEAIWAHPEQWQWRQRRFRQ